MDNYSIIIIDEAHERTIYTDILLGVLKKIISTNEKPHLKMVVTSATINPKKFSEYLGNCKILEIAGTLFPIEEIYLNWDI